MFVDLFLKLKRGGVPVSLTGDGSWLVTNSDPGPGWQTSTAGMVTPNLATSSWGGQPNGLLASGAQWVWYRNSAREDLDPENWYVLHFDACSATSSE